MKRKHKSFLDFYKAQIEKTGIFINTCQHFNLLIPEYIFLSFPDPCAHQGPEILDH